MKVNQVEIYVLKHPLTGEIRYVGKANSAQKRLKTHIRDSRTRKTPVYCWMNKLQAENLVPQIEVVAVCYADNWKEAEINIIAKYRQSNRLLNVALGGDEPYCSLEQRAINGRNNARAIHDNPFQKKIWSLKRAMGADLKFLKENGMHEAYNRIIQKLKLAASKAPHLFGSFASLQEI